jgi:hypothetical protein
MLLMFLLHPFLHTISYIIHHKLVVPNRIELIVFLTDYHAIKYYPLKMNSSLLVFN